MGSYIDLSCKEPLCRFTARIGDLIEFFLAGGRELPYGHPRASSAVAARAGVAGYWRDLLCWNCGETGRDSIKLGKPVMEPAMALALCPPPDLQGHPRSCPTCGGILCDVQMLRMFLEFRQDPAAARAEVREQIERLKKRRKAPVEEVFEELLSELCGREGDPLDRLVAAMKELEGVDSEEALILQRLNLVPDLPVSKQSLAPLRDRYMTVCAECEALRDDMFAKMEEETNAWEPEHKSNQGDWLMRPAIRAKLATDTKHGELRTLLTFRWVAERLIEDQKGTFEMFSRRCPKCKAPGLSVHSFQT